MVGVGTRLVTFRDLEPVGLVCKLVELEGLPKMKLTGSFAKMTLPFAKNVFEVETSGNELFVFVAAKSKVLEENQKIRGFVRNDKNFEELKF